MYLLLKTIATFTQRKDLAHSTKDWDPTWWV